MATRLFGALEETLDSSSLKLRSQAGNPEKLVKDRGTQLFLFVAVNKIGVASACVERLFAKYKRWSADTNHPLCPAHSAANHATSEFQTCRPRATRANCWLLFDGIKSETISSPATEAKLGAEDR